MLVYFISSLYNNLNSLSSNIFLKEILPLTCDTFYTNSMWEYQLLKTSWHTLSPGFTCSSIITYATAAISTVSRSQSYFFLLRLLFLISSKLSFSSRSITFLPINVTFVSPSSHKTISSSYHRQTCPTPHWSFSSSKFQSYFISFHSFSLINEQFPPKEKINPTIPIYAITSNARYSRFINGDRIQRKCRSNTLGKLVSFDSHAFVQRYKPKARLLHFYLNSVHAILGRAST